MARLVSVFCLIAGLSITTTGCTNDEPQDFEGGNASAPLSTSITVGDSKVTLCNLPRHTRQSTVRLCGYTVPGLDASAITAAWFSVDGGSVISVVPGNGGFVDTSTSLPEGTHTVRLYAQSAAGNITFEEKTVTVDLTPPTLVVLYPTSSDTLESTVVDVKSSVSDPLPVRVQTQWYVSSPVDSGVGTVTHTIDLINRGYSTLLVSATDAVGNVTEVRVRVYVRPLGPPPPAVSGWTTASPLAFGRIHHEVTLLPSAKVLVSGGAVSSASCFSSTELYDPVTGTWSSTSSMTSPRCFHGANLLPSGGVLVHGGITSGDEVLPLTSSELFNPATGKWTSAGAMTTYRYAHASVLLNSGKVLVIGGDTGYRERRILSSTELYDPATKSWSAAASMKALRSLATATLLPSGKVLVTGGHNNSAPVNSSAELYNPATNSWSSAGSMAKPRYHHRATLLPSGKVLITGGVNHSEVLSSAELYDPETNSWSSAGSMASTRSTHSATLLPSGKVLVAGGSRSSIFLASAELYDPVTNSWSAVTPMAMPRNNHKAALVSSGKVLIIGGYDGNAFPSTTELFTP
jgi:N-acetylneuraminic acid mutarotase